MAGYIGSKASVVSSGAERKKTFAITTSTTALTGLVYTPTKVHVFHNGVRLVDGTDFTATNGTSITLTVAAESGDQVVVVSYASFQVADAYTQTEADAEFVAKAGDTMTGPLSVTGTVAATTLQTTAGGTVTTASGNDLNIVYPASRSLFIKEGSETHVTVDNAGNVLVGTTSGNPTGNHEPGTFIAEYGQINVHRDGGNPLRVGSSVDGNLTEYYKQGALVGSIGNTGGYLYIGSPQGTDAYIGMGGAQVYPSTSTGAYRDNAIDIGSGNGRFKDLYLSGDSFVGEPSTIGAGETGVTVRGLGQIRVGRSGTASATLVSFNNSNGEVGRISTSGSATSYVTSSDYRLKTDAQPMIGASARVQALNPVNFEWIADGTRVDGFLAHEAATVVPESVTGTKDAMRDEEYEVTAAIEATYDDDGNELTAAVDAVMGTRSVPDYQGIDQSKLVPLLTAALQEALNKIDTMETRLAALEGN